MYVFVLLCHGPHTECMYLYCCVTAHDSSCVVGLDSLVSSMLLSERDGSLGEVCLADIATADTAAFVRFDIVVSDILTDDKPAVKCEDDTWFLLTYFSNDSLKQIIILIIIILTIIIIIIKFLKEYESRKKIAVNAKANYDTYL